jgi:hypothetical protein
MFVSDALSRDTVSEGIVYCGRFLEALCVLCDNIERDRHRLLEEN